MKIKIIMMILITTLIILSIIIFLLPKRQSNQLVEPVITPTPIVYSSGYLHALIPTLQAQVPVPFTCEGEKKLENLLVSRQPLSSTETTAKQNILQHMDVTTGIVFIQPTFQVDYISGLSEFQVEIQTTDIQAAKKDAIAWFASQGLQANSLCKLPVMFYLNFTVAHELRGKGIRLNPVPDNC